MASAQRVKKRRVETYAAEELREHMRSSWPSGVTGEGEGARENNAELCVEHDAPHRHCGLERWSVQGRFGENRRFGLFASFFRYAVTGDEELSDGEDSVVYAAAVSWVMVDHETKKYYRFSELDPRAPILAAYLAANEKLAGDEYFLQALSEQFVQERLPLPDRAMTEPASVRAGALELRYGENQLVVIPSKKKSKKKSLLATNFPSAARPLRQGVRTRNRR
ncbi:uncharacterized protein Tco025E_05537 [Trypanosoma conorhini]|uniref:Uncharacterized protein n=1 Tax=Trypanosoma conorhini TaxID=83891 RepID=A0A422PCF9_9TRYP|nr:uncharacterized protein Tco025E_05537 [Trypanosoma conorhini]RNF15386.1 hypothetical protein Tco025E_05537 [Trypanosoma conorhini]